MFCSLLVASTVCVCIYYCLPSSHWLSPALQTPGRISMRSVQYICRVLLACRLFCPPLQCLPTAKTNIAYLVLDLSEHLLLDGPWGFLMPLILMLLIHLA
jgi:hypothetical protein